MVPAAFIPVGYTCTAYCTSTLASPIDAKATILVAFTVLGNDNVTVPIDPVADMPVRVIGPGPRSAKGAPAKGVIPNI